MVPRSRTPRCARAPRGLLLLAGAHAAFAFDFDDVAALARRKARAPYQPPDRAQPAELELLGYDEYRDIRFRPDRAIWRAEGCPFDLMFFHRAQSNPRVRMNEVVDGQGAPPSLRQRRLRLRQEHAVAARRGASSTTRAFACTTT